MVTAATGFLHEDPPTPRSFAHTYAWAHYIHLLHTSLVPSCSDQMRAEGQHSLSLPLSFSLSLSLPRSLPYVYIYLYIYAYMYIFEDEHLYSLSFVWRAGRHTIQPTSALYSVYAYA